MKKLSIVITTLLAAVFIALVFIHIDINVNHYLAQMDADIASDTILTEVLYDNGFVTPDTWVGSTEVCVISAPNLAAFIYPLVGQNMNLSMGIACSIMMLLLLAVMMVYFKQIGFNWNEILASLIVLFSLSDIRTENQSMLFLWAAYYASHFIALFIILIFYNKSLEKNTVTLPVILITCVLAVLNGMQGLHADLYCYFPVLGIEIIRRLYFIIKKDNKSSWMITIWLFVITAISYATTEITSSFGMGASRNIRHAGEKFIGNVLPDMLGVIYFGDVKVIGALVCIIALIGYVLLVRKMKETDIGLWAPVVSFGICALALTFTTVESTPRYFITELFIAGIGVALFMRKFREQLALIGAALVLILGIIAGRYYYDQLVIGDRSAESSEYLVGAWMQENGYEYGYSTFDFANFITVDSNNAVKVRAVNSMNELKGCKWLTDSTWYPPVKSVDGETVYIASESKEADLKQFISDNNVNVVRREEIGSFKVYVFDKDYTIWE
ncbi:hypothetical protein bpr_I0462 [Butyrivibrio proteoclasticus B316]|uniref:Dolichyl-phosphate-mannose-protein mannosyltransferase n=1 Tax=Butyrivibrio proteoclasticus (strain ATCC 51982 / DSM 14932 / B316) TaxID=515622 RepID=E0S009_BUTPB|nr:hypothetical protein [Butyrivibrio proteoclasticus]ADL33210.1 hypothetical protein bpr_I0462 [Butyrivibrio proteoclasticus B316]